MQQSGNHYTACLASGKSKASLSLSNQFNKASNEADHIKTQILVRVDSDCESKIV